MAKRGIFDELNRQIKIAEQNQRRQRAAAERERAQAARAYEQAQRVSERAQRASERADLAQQKAGAKADKEAYLAMKLAEVEKLNADLKCEYEALDSILEATLAIDDFVDLESLRITDDKFPAFDPGSLGEEIPNVEELNLPPEPTFNPPTAPSGISGLFGGKKHAELLETLRAEFEVEMNTWTETVHQLEQDHKKAVEERAALEERRISDLDLAKTKFLEECRTEAAKSNEELDALIRDLAFDIPEAVNEYVTIVLNNSIYPDNFQVTNSHEFDIETREVAVTVNVPGPDTMPKIKEFKYIKAQDAIVSSELSPTALKSRYNSVIFQTAIRTMHEIFEADRSAKISSVALKVVTSALNKATGNGEEIPFVIVSAAREKFLEFNLAQIDASATMKYLGASISKSPYDLQPADSNRGIRAGGK